MTRQLPRTPIQSYSAASTDGTISTIDGDARPPVSQWQGHVAIIPAGDDREGPCYGVLESRGTEPGLKVGGRSSGSRSVWIAGELVDQLQTEVTFVVPSDEVQFASTDEFQLNAHMFL